MCFQPRKKVLIFFTLFDLFIQSPTLCIISCSWKSSSLKVSVSKMHAAAGQNKSYQGLNIHKLWEPTRVFLVSSVMRTLWERGKFVIKTIYICLKVKVKVKNGFPTLILYPSPHVPKESLMTSMSERTPLCGSCIYLCWTP